MKRKITLIEIFVIIVITITLLSMGFGIYRNVINDSNYTYEEWFYPESTKARYQREIVEELRRANDLKEQENNNR